MATVRWRWRRVLAKHSMQLSSADVARRYSAIVACLSRFCTCSCKCSTAAAVAASSLPHEMPSTMPMRTSTVPCRCKAFLRQFSTEQGSRRPAVEIIRHDRARPAAVVVHVQTLFTCLSLLQAACTGHRQLQRGAYLCALLLSGLVHLDAAVEVVLIVRVEVLPAETRPLAPDVIRQGRVHVILGTCTHNTVVARRTASAGGAAIVDVM